MDSGGVILLVTWDGGGNVPPMLALGQRLARRGHAVRALGTQTVKDRAEHAGLEFTALTRVPDLDRSAGTAMEDQIEVFLRQLSCPELSEDVIDALDQQRPDVIVIDSMQTGAFNAAEARQITTVALLHYLPSFAGSGPEVMIPLLNVSRAALGLHPLDETIGPFEQLWVRCGCVLAATLREIDNATNTFPGIRYVGPIFDPDPPDWTWDLPWPADQPEPLVIVSFGSTYQHQEQQLQRALDALAPLNLRTLVTLGPGLQATDIDPPAGVVVRQWVPHRAVLPYATLIVTHAGHTTIMNAIADAVPMVCLPTGRDQLFNAQRVADSGLGIALEPEATTEQIRAAVQEVLTNSSYRHIAERMARKLKELCESDPAVTEIEALLAPAPSP